MVGVVFTIGGQHLTNILAGGYGVERGVMLLPMDDFIGGDRIVEVKGQVVGLRESNAAQLI